MTRKSTQLMAIALTLGIMGMAFTCEVVNDEEVTLQWSWTIEGHATSDTDYDQLCDWAGWGSATIRLLIDVDEDTTEDYYYDAECGWTTAQTDPAQDPADYAPGDTVWFAFQLLGADGTVYAQSENYVTITLVEGVNDLGSVDFDFDSDPMDCTTDLSWLETEFDTYDLIVDGDDAAGTTVWGSTCAGLVVDDDTENAWECDILMTSSP